MTTTKWAHLPNAVHIDRVLASAKANPGQWTQRRRVCASWSVAWDVLTNQGRLAVWDAVWGAERVEAWEASRYFAQYASRYFAQYAILALVAYDDCAYMLDSDPTELAILAAFGDPRAVLLLPACKVFHSLT